MTLSTAGLGFFWAVALSVEDLLDARDAIRDRFEQAPTGFPFAPPPPPGRDRE